MILINEILKLFEESFKKLNINLTPTILESNRPELSDFQCNDALILSKQMKKNPKEIAKEIVLNIKKNNIEKISIDGPGFINVTLKKDFIASLINKIKNDVNLGFLKNKTGEKIIVDYAGMNIAKIMHVGHLRSNIIGQALLNLGKYVGNEMIGDAHLGD
jgi:arginyl-tRNA synthetase